MNRRHFLTGLGTLAVLVSGGCIWYADEEGAFSQGRGPAFRPWNEWDKPKTGMIALVQAGILAASPHNTQPWLFRVQGNSVDVFADRTRNTGGLDPYLRELHIGIGCALENMTVAAPSAGYRATIESVEGRLQLHQEGAGVQRVATVRCVPSVSPEDPLYSALPHRHTNRTPYEMRPLPAPFVNELLAANSPLGKAASPSEAKLFLFADDVDRKNIADLVSRSDGTVYQNKGVDQGTAPWERVFHWKDVEQHRDGITLADYGATSLQASVLYCLPDSLEKKVIAQTAKGGYAKLLAASPLFGVIAVRDRYSVNQCVQAGRLWEHAHLFATANGIAARPINEAVELIDLENAKGHPPSTEAKLAELTGDSSWQPTFMFRMGYAATSAPASPRRGLAQVTLNA